MAKSEYEALVNNTNRMISAISTDITAVASKLFAKKLIPSLSSAQISKEEEAMELVRKINNKVSTTPENFEVLLAVLNEIPSLQDLAMFLDEERKKIKAQKLIQQQEELPSQHITDSHNQAPVSPDRFPYLKSEPLIKRRERLIEWLEIESRKMQNKFAILVDKTRESLEKSKVACNDLSVLIRHSQRNILLPLTKKYENITDLFLKLGDYWSFFDYEFLSEIINRHCPELISELTDYVSTFKKYCERRICEVPADVFAKKGDEHILYVKCDCNFNKATVKDIKELECQLSDLLNTEICLLGVEEGCIKMTFHSLCAISTPLSPKQNEQLMKLRVLHLHSDTIEYFNSTEKSSIISSQPSIDYRKGAYLRSKEREMGQLRRMAAVVDGYSG